MTFKSHVVDALDIIYFASILMDEPKKREQLKRAAERTFLLTSEEGCSVKVEYFEDGIKRLTLTGTRSNFTMCVKGGYVIRKPRNVELLYVAEQRGYYFSDFLK